MTIFFLISAIILLVGYMLFLSRRKDYELLRKPPSTLTLPKAKLEQAKKELEAFQKQPPPKSRKSEIARNSELYYLQHRLRQIQDEIESEQKNYYLACKERDIAWQDYADYFSSMSFIEKYFAFGKIGNLKSLRKLYLDTVRKVDVEISKFKAQSRVRNHEVQRQQERDDEIEQKSSFQESTQSARNASIESVQETLQEAFEEMDPAFDTIENSSPARSEASQQEVSTSSDQTAPPHQPSEGELPEWKEESFSSIQENHFGQEDFSNRFPDFKGLSYIDETLSLSEIGQSAVIDANFDESYFVSVIFNGRHQYKNCSFKATDFSYAVWKAAEKPHRFVSCDFNQTRFNHARLEYMAVYNCRFFEADFQGVQLYKVKFVNCRFENCYLDGVDFSKTVMSSDMLEQIDFSNCASPPKNAAAPVNQDPSKDETGSPVAAAKLFDPAEGSEESSDP